MKNRIIISGNHNANYVQIEKVNENKIQLTVGDCCVLSIDCILTAEVLSNALSNIAWKNHNNLIIGLSKELGWDEEINKLYLKGCENKL